MLWRLFSGVASWGCALVAEPRRLTVVASRVEHWCVGLQHHSCPALEHRFSGCGAWTSCFMAYGSFRMVNLCLLHWQANSLPLRHREFPIHKPSSSSGPFPVPVQWLSRGRLLVTLDCSMLMIFLPFQDKYNFIFSSSNKTKN